MSADEKRISEFAHQIWESEGRPHGQHDRHWEMATKLAEAEALAPKKDSAQKAAKPKLPKVDGVAAAKPAAKPAKPAASKAKLAPAAAAPAAKPAAPAAKPAAPAAKPTPAAKSAPAAKPAPAAKKPAAVKKPKPPAS